MKVFKVLQIWFKYPPFGILQISNVMTSFTNWGSFIAMLVLLDDITKSGIQLGFLWAISGLLPLLFSFVLGTLVDRFSSKKILILLEFLMSILYLFFLFIIPLSHFNLYLAWLLFILIRFLTGVFSNLQGTAFQSIIPHIIKQEDLTIANSLSYSINSLVRLSGATLGGVMLAFLSINIMWVINSFALLISGILLIIGLKSVNSIKAQVVRRHFFQEVKDGIRISVKNPYISWVLLASLFGGMIIGSYNLLLQQFSYNIYHTSSGGLSTLYVVEGLLSFIVALIIASKNIKFKEPQKMWIGYFIFGLGWFIFGFTNQLFLGVCALILFASASPFFSNYEKLTMQTQIPVEYRGRIFGFWGSTYSISIQIGAFLTGVIISLFGLAMVPKILGSLEMLFAICFFIYFNTVKNKLGSTEIEVNILNRN